MLAKLWDRSEDGSLECQLCAHACKIRPGRAGICGVRCENRGELHTLVGNIATAINMDPVEKKPLYHFLPGTRTFSIGSAGCNFHCRFCQNSGIAHVNPQSRITGRKVTPESMVRLAIDNNAPSISFTYNEPTVFFEQIHETAGLAKARGLKTILVSNGYMGPAFLQTMANRIDAANIDLKSFSDDFYRSYCGGRLEPVLENLKKIRKIGWWLEVTTLVIPGVNDSKAELGKIAAFIRDELGEDTPWHVSAFHGAADMLTHPSTTPEKMEEAWETGLAAGLKHVYIGNVNTVKGSATLCPECAQTVIERRGWRSRSVLKNGHCPGCGRKVAGIWG